MQVTDGLRILYEMDSHEPSELETYEQARPRPLPAAIFRLLVVEGPDRDRSWEIEPEQGSLLLGTAPSCDVRLSDRSVSRRHLELEIEGGMLHVTDLASKNGTVVNDVVCVEVRLRGGELLHVGGTVLRVERRHPRADAAPSGALAMRTRLGRMVGASAAMQRVYRAAERLVGSSAPILIEGEPGTGKELFAETLHELGSRARGPFVVLRAADVFERADAGETSAIELAAGGTLVLREVTDLEPATQAKLASLLSALRGSSTSATASAGHFDVRVVATTSRSLDVAVERGAFDAGLADLLGALRVELPPLRRREGDVELLAAQFWAQMGGPPSGLRTEVLSKLAARPWPGNVPELALEIARLVGAAADKDPGNAMVTLDAIVDVSLPFSRIRQRVLDRFERRYIEKMLAKWDGNVSRASEAAGIARRYFQVVKSRHHL
ncbi:MAG: sigma 54-interacting transcriptional regulator [Polyangiaceae bacterium]